MHENDNVLPSCCSDLSVTAACLSSPFIQRRAVGSSGRISWLYDAINDQIISGPNVFNDSTVTFSCQRKECFMKPCDPNLRSNLLKWCNTEDELRLSVALQLCESKGIGEFINYSGSIDEYTRFLCYTHHQTTEYFKDEVFTSNTIKPRKLVIDATHAIVLVNFGIEALVVLQLPPDDEQVQTIDHALERLCTLLKGDQQDVTLSGEHKESLEKILQIKVFSNTAELTGVKSVLDLHPKIQSSLKNEHLLKPLNYNLCPINYIYDTRDENKYTFTELSNADVIAIESYLLPFSVDLKNVARAMGQSYPNLRQHLKGEHKNMLTSYQQLKAMYNNEIHRIRKLVIDIRRGDIKESKIHEELSNDLADNSRKMLADFRNQLKKIQKKDSFIEDLSEKGFIYQNAADREIYADDNRQVLEQKVLGGATSTHIICSNDTLYEKSQSKWHTLCDQLLKEREGNPQLNLIYVDFSYVPYKLNDFIILPTTEIISNLDETQPITAPKSERSKSVEPINILLLGESGVGKSTFINAFVNYLKFDDLKQAEKNPTVLIPVSFMITVDDNFTERVVKYECADDLNNEDHDNLGKSITQHCKSYVFTLQDGRNRGQKLRIIDTPGIGDTEGLNQDDKNMQHVLSYINNLTHLNAICILLKPNNSRLTVFFRSRFTQLIDMLGENICDRIIFCFTNARSTFYTPGDTGPLLKALLNSLPAKRIPFSKENTFCFDSESFRYLVAKLNRIKFNSMEEADYNGSWEKSMTELNRLIGYIHSNMSDPIILNDSHSAKHAQLMINSMIRPMLEAMRNTLRNIILLNERWHKTCIELCPKIIKGTTAICLECPRKCIKICDFWVATDGLHVVQNKCRTCQCDPSQHYRIDYELEYKEIENSAKPTEEDMRKVLHNLCEASAEFSYFLLQSAGNSQHDPFLLGFERMIKEESDICGEKTPYEFNLHLVEQLQLLKTHYEKANKKLATKKMITELDVIYQKIENVNKHRMIKQQMNAIQGWYKFMTKYYESDVPINKGNQ
ncbi:unnamed protein product [Rotaria socialis]|uniref:G domain-containing protein n=3 Tax=Rotaria socialis TaxID=392032 RepID=A0A818CUF0_9BILA|nr:unnamed protein product [Rotaria socialis]